MDGYKNKRNSKCETKEWTHNTTKNQPSKTRVVDSNRKTVWEKNKAMQLAVKKGQCLNPKKISICLYSLDMDASRNSNCLPKDQQLQSTVPLHSALLICSPLLAKTSCSVRVIVRLIISSGAGLNRSAPWGDLLLLQYEHGKNIRTS